MNDDREEAPTSFGRGVGSFFWELLKAFLIAVVIIVPIRYFLVQPFFVRGASMEPTFDDGQYLVIDQLSYRFREPQRGEVIVFRYPNQPSQFFIKRIIGLPGETVHIENGQVLIQNSHHPDGVILNEVPYLPADIRTGGQETVTLAEHEYFVLGDNRPSSSDSRSWGPLPAGGIIGRVWVRAF
ncbi:MAG: signal peptidase I, partial [Candidatus Sungbacteria bacterium]|nr:signal peptidase I [Candidatus Sungbacteria bacterium]